jgi:hypothetical protein
MAEDFEVGSAAPEEKSNRTFVIAAGAVGGLLVLSMVCLAVYALVVAPRQKQANFAQQTQIVVDNATKSAAMTETVAALHPTNTKAPTKTPVPSATMTPTAVVVVASPTPTSAATIDPGIATAIAQATLAAAQGGGGKTPTPTALPATGFADEVGLPGLVLLGALLVVVVIISRQLRMRTTT